MIPRRVSHWIESFDPEREPGTSSIGNAFTFVPESCKLCALKCRLTKEGMKKPEQAHFGSKLDPVSCKHTLRSGLPKLRSLGNTY